MKRIRNFYRNLRILFWIFDNKWRFNDSISLHKLVKEARYALGYDDIGEWF